MLTIKRVATVVSNYQETLEDVAGCGRNCLGACCLHGAKLPLYMFEKTTRIHPKDHGGVINAAASEQENNAFLDTLILAQWEERMSRGLFRYDVTACETKVLPGDYGYIAQLNEGRHLKKRPTEFRVDKVLQEFDPKKFNFTKVGQEELLFCLKEGTEEGDHYYEKARVSGSPNAVVINVSPIEYGHVLLVPRLLDCIPQQIELETFTLAIQMAAKANNHYFRLGFNSLGAFATINHLHFQAYYLAAPFPVERAPTTTLFHSKSYKISELAHYPVRGLVYELTNGCIDEIAIIVVKACQLLQDQNIPFNVLIADRGSRIFVFPQCFAEKQARGEVDVDILETQVNPAVWEISGHIVLKRKEDYENASEESAWKLLAEVSLSEEKFQEVKSMSLGVLDGFGPAISKLVVVNKKATNMKCSTQECTA